MTGDNLIEVLCLATGLPSESIQKEVKSLIAAAGLNPEQISLEEIREIMALYLQHTLVKAKKELTA